MIDSIKAQDCIYCVVLEKKMHGTLPLNGKKGSNPAPHSMIGVLRRYTALRVVLKLMFVCLFVFVCFCFAKVVGKHL